LGGCPGKAAAGGGAEMVARFEADGIAFRYPENWSLERDEQETGWSVTVQSPETAFLILTFDTDGPDIGAIADAALETLRAEYPDLESDPAVESIAGQPAVGHDVRFFSFDLTNSAGIRAFRSENGTVLVLWQFTDLEYDRSEPVLRAIRTSIEEV
jgi:hypothetical protein